MVTNNFRKILFGEIFGSTGSADSFPEFSSVTLVDSDGNNTTNSGAFNINAIINALNHLGEQESSGVSTIKVGTGTTTPTQNDYDIKNKATGITCNSTSIGFTSNLTKTYTATFSNSTASDINITELGLFVTNDSEKTFLLDRTVLSTPITIPAGQSKSITYEIAL